MLNWSKLTNEKLVNIAIVGIIFLIVGFVINYIRLVIMGVGVVIVVLIFYLLRGYYLN